MCFLHACMVDGISVVILKIVACAVMRVGINYGAEIGAADIPTTFVLCHIS